MTFKGITDSIMESEQEEVERLAQAPEGSLLRHLSTLPVNIRGDLRGRIIEVPEKDGGRIVVVPFDTSGSASRRSDDRLQRHGLWWEVAVVQSDHLSYPVGGHHLVMSEAELVRGHIVGLDLQ